MRSMTVCRLSIHSPVCDAILRVWQEAELRAKAESREMARNAVGVMGAGGDPRHKQRQYAEELEEQLRMKKVTGFVVLIVTSPLEGPVDMFLLWLHAWYAGGGVEGKGGVA